MPVLLCRKPVVPTLSAREFIQLPCFPLSGEEVV
jgi:hypothetical protein